MAADEPLPRRDRTLAVALDWLEAHCVIPDGFRRGEPFQMYDYQFRYLADFYKVRGDVEPSPSEVVLAPAFVYRRGLLVGPQKIGKGPATAAHCCLEGVGPAVFAGWAGKDDGYACADHDCRCGWEYAYEPGEPMGMPWPTPLLQLVALSIEQVDNVYGALRPMIEQGPLGDLIPKTGEEFIRLPGGGRIDAVTSSAQSRLGQRVTFVAMDECGLWTAQNKMVKVADTQFRGLAGMGGRASLTTNAWDPAENSVAQQQYESAATDIVRHFKQAPARLSYRNKVERRRIHRFVYGETLKEHGGHIDLDSIEAEASDLLERDPAQAERFFGSRLVHGTGSYMPPELWESADARGRIVKPGTPVCAGFDGSDSDDYSAIRLETVDGHAFTPTYGPDNRPTIWDPKAWGGEIPRHEVEAAWSDICKRYRVLRAYCDPRDWQTEIGNWALKYGEKVFVEWATGRITQMHAALQRNLVDLQSGKRTHDGCTLTTTHVLNARKSARAGQKYILEKPSPQQKIDACMSDVLAHEAWADATAAGDFVRAMERKSSKMIVMR